MAIYSHKKLKVMYKKNKEGRLFFAIPSEMNWEEVNCIFVINFKDIILGKSYLGSNLIESCYLPISVPCGHNGAEHRPRLVFFRK